MKVEGILRSKGAKVVTVRPDASLASLVQKLREEQIGAVSSDEDAGRRCSGSGGGRERIGAVGAG